MKMKKLMYLFTFIILTTGLSIQAENLMLQEWDTPFQTPPFDKIKSEYFMPAFVDAMKAEIVEVEAIANNKKEPAFKNTIEALEKSGEMLDRVSRVFGCLNSANTNDELQNTAKQVAPLRAKHNDDIKLNEKLFARIKQIYENKASLGLSAEQNILLENYYLGFVRSGANLNDEDKEKLRKINEELSNLYVSFKQNHLKQTNAVALVIDKADDLAGLPDRVLQAAAETAKSFSKHISTAAITATNMIIRSLYPGLRLSGSARRICWVIKTTQHSFLKGTWQRIRRMFINF